MKTSSRLSRQGAETIRARSANHYVVLLNHTARFPAETIQDYMQTFSAITEAFSGVTLRHDTAENFVADLKASGRLIHEGDRYTLLPSMTIAPAPAPVTVADI